MKVSQLYRWAGIVGIVAGILNILIEVLPENLAEPLNLLVVTLALWVLTALYLRQRLPGKRSKVELNNSIRRASQIVLELTLSPQAVQLSVKDDGRGFDQSGTPHVDRIPRQQHADGGGRTPAVALQKR